MAWRDELQPASFRGVPFEVVTGSLTAGRRLARHEYPQRDIPYLEDMGRRARDYKVEGYIIGPDYMIDRDRLLDAIESAGAGQLVHPYYGNKLVTVGECELTESTEFGGMVKFTLPCVEAGEQIQPTSGIDSAAHLIKAQESAFAQIAADFSSAFSVSGLPAWGVSSIASTVTGFLALPDFQAMGSVVSGLTSNISALLATPDVLADEMISLVRSSPSVDGTLGAANIPAVTTQGIATRGTVQNQQSAITVLIKRAALIHYAGIAANEGIDTSDDVATARAAVLAQFDAHDYAVGVPRPSSVLASQLRSVRSASLTHLSRQNAALPQTYALTLVQPQPALALSYALYGDLRTNEIISRNAIQHPGFLPAGVPLQLTAT